MLNMLVVGFIERVIMENYKIKYCPDLTSYEEVKAMLIGQGDFTRPVVHACLKEKCAAYDSQTSMCDKYKNSVIYYDEVKE